MPDQERARDDFQPAGDCSNEDPTAGDHHTVQHTEFQNERRTLDLAKSKALELKAALDRERQDSAICMGEDDGDRSRASANEEIESDLQNSEDQLPTIVTSPGLTIPEVIVTPGTPTIEDLSAGVDGATELKSPWKYVKTPSPGFLSADLTGGSTSTKGFFNQESPMVSPRNVHLEDDDKAWDDKALLELSNTCRRTLLTSMLPGPEDLEVIDDIMEEFLNESHGHLVDFKLIIFARLDKLLEAIITASTNNPGASKSFEEIAKKARQVERKWQMTFKGRFFMINHQRTVSMSAAEGPLAHLSLYKCSVSEGPEWITDRVADGSTDNFKPGNWWLNLTCAYRDGIVCNDMGQFTASAKGIPTVCLIKGIEVEGTRTSTTKYVYEGSVKDLQLRLMSYFHKPVRVLRGYRLRSKHAPVAGIRYDGIYVVRTYSHKRISMEEDLFRVEITIEREGNQRGVSEINCIPTPSQIDDWDLYQQIRDGDAKRRLKPLEYQKWRATERLEYLSRCEWHREEDFNAYMKQRK